MATNISTPLQTLRSHSSDVTCCDFGKNFSLASCSSDKTVRTWEWIPGKGYKELGFSPTGQHTYGVTDARFSPQGTMLATSSVDGSTVLWNIRTGCRIHTFVHPNGNAVRVCRFTMDSTQLISAGDDGTISIWNLAHRTLVRTLKGHEETVQALAVSPDSTVLVSGCSQGLLLLWDLEGNLLATQESAHDLGVTGTDFSPIPTSNKNEFLLGSCGRDHVVRLWLVQLGKVRPKFEAFSSLRGHTSSVLCVRFCPSKGLLASGGLDKTIRIWETTGKCVKILDGHDRYITSCAFSRDGVLLASGSNDKSVKVWDLSGKLTISSELVPCIQTSSERAGAVGGSSEVQLVKHVEEEAEEGQIKLLQRLDCGVAVNSCHFSPGNLEFLAAATADKAVKVWHHKAGRFKETPYSPIDAHRYSVHQVEISPEVTLMASCSLDGTAALWNLEDGRRSQICLQSSGAGVRTCRFAPNGQWVVTGGDDEKAIVWNIPSSIVHASLVEHTEAVAGTAFTPDSSFLATGDLDGTIRIWCLANQRCLATMKSAHDMGTLTCDFSPSEGALKGMRYLLASGGNDSMVRLWSVEFKLGKAKISQSKCLEGHGGTITCVRFCSSGQLVASTASDKTARVWNVYQGVCQFVLESHTSIVTCCSFSGDGALLATGSLDKSVIIWELPKDISLRSCAEERLKERWRKLEEWGPRDISRWLAWLELPSVPHSSVSGLTGSDLIAISAQELAQRLSLDDNGTYVVELSRQLFWLHQQQTCRGQWEELLQGCVPHELLCPITQELFKEPVLCPDGFTYERAAIDEWFLSGKFTSPMTNLPLTEACYTPNVQLRSQILGLLFGEP